MHSMRLIVPALWDHSYPTSD